MLHYAGLDERINAGIPDFEAALKENEVTYQLFVYENVNHAFNNDTNAARHDEKAAELAWGRTVNFFTDALKWSSPGGSGRHSRRGLYRAPPAPRQEIGRASCRYSVDKS